MAESNSVKTLEIRYLAMFVSLSIVNFLGSQRRGEARLCVSRLSPSEFITSNSRPTVCNSNPAQLASISILLREVLSSFWGSWDAPFLVVLVTHWPQG